MNEQPSMARIQYMNATQNVTIPYERQSEPETGRTCGAACLSMVYRSFGEEVPQTQIWPSIAKANRAGNPASTTHLMARDALTRGFSAIAIQIRHPLQALRICLNSGIRSILNHRLKEDAPTGHYSVMVDIDDKNVVLHDPYYGPARKVPHAELLGLWQRRFSSSEIVGNMLIGVAAQPSSIAGCQLCQTPIPSTAQCPKCAQKVLLQPSALLGCMNTACAGRMWNYICCPACDYTWTFTLQPPVGHSPHGVSDPAYDPKAVEHAERDPWDLTPLFTQLDKFCNHILSLPGAADHPAIKNQLDFIAANKEKLALATAEERANLKAHEDRMVAMAQAAREEADAHRQTLEELNKRLPQLDGDVLGHALLKALGFDSLNRASAIVAGNGLTIRDLSYLNENRERLRERL
jgi:Papain-like cysteine protease AvrRpt2